MRVMAQRQKTCPGGASDRPFLEEACAEAIVKGVGHVPLMFVFAITWALVHYDECFFSPQRSGCL